MLREFRKARMPHVIEAQGLERVQHVHEIPRSLIPPPCIPILNRVFDALVPLPYWLQLVTHCEVEVGSRSYQFGAERRVPNAAIPPRIKSRDFDMVTKKRKLRLLTDPLAEFISRSPGKGHHEKPLATACGMLSEVHASMQQAKGLAASRRG